MAKSSESASLSSSQADSLTPRTSPTPPTPRPRLLYLHGFASSPASSKAVRFHAHARERFALEIERLDLRVPSFSHLRISVMMGEVIRAIGGPEERVILMGSSLGGLTAAHVAAVEPRVCGLVLLAPAFQIAQRWEERLGRAAFTAWRESGWLEVDDHALKTKGRVDFAFIEEVGRLCAHNPDVRVPTLVIHGAKDDVVLPEASRQFSAGKPHVRRIEVDDGHELNATMTAWLREVDAFLTPFFGAPHAE